ncbi:MAG: hypothetical protein AAF483_16085 [Planctomycetota bacterium]
MDKTTTKNMPTRNDIWEYYFNGLLRNINGILAGVYGPELPIPLGNRTRGERSDLVLEHILHHFKLQDVISSLRDPVCRQEKQAGASLHDLAFSHAMLSAAQKLCFGKPSRASSLFGASMLLGNIVRHLRECYCEFHQVFEDALLGECSDETLRNCLAESWAPVEARVQQMIERETRSDILRNLEHELQSPRFLLGVFGLLAHYGLDDRAFESFLGE